MSELAPEQLAAKIAAAEEHKLRVRNNTADHYRLFAEGLEARHWWTLGYPNPAAWWRDLTDFSAVPLEIRQRLAVELRNQGLSLRTIAEELRISKSKVQRDLSHDGTPDDGTPGDGTPDWITGADGKTYPARQVSHDETPDDEPADLTGYDLEVVEPQSMEDVLSALTGSEPETADPDGMAALLDAASDSWVAVRQAAGLVHGVTVDKGRNPLDLHGWTLTIPARQRARASELQARLAEAADEYLTLSRLVDRALAEPKAPRGRKPKEGG